MLYKSTRTDTGVSFHDALFGSLARDGGLYLPETVPTFPSEEIARYAHFDRVDLGYVIMRTYINDIPEAKLKAIVRDALDFPLPIRDVGPYQVLELHHGPTLAFKDVAARVLARLMGYYLEQDKAHSTILVATSGDTGGAVANAFSEIPHTKVVVLFPKGRVSHMQYDQLTQVGDNVIPIEIEGSFDDCQALVKQAFADQALAFLHLTSANSINIGRLLPQVIYHAYASMHKRSPDTPVIIPSGNLGNATAALLARQMGFPVGKILLAVNENDAVYRYHLKGVYEPAISVQTFSNAMDVGDPNNFPRLLNLCGGSHTSFQRYIDVVKVSDAETIETMKQVYADHNYLLDPHSAVAWTAAQKKKLEEALIIATAAPVKFVSEIQARTGLQADVPQKSDKYATRKTTLRPLYEDFCRFLVTHV